MANSSHLILELNAVGACSARANLQTDRRTKQIHKAATLDGKIQIHPPQGVVPAVAAAIAKTPYCLCTGTRSLLYLSTCE